MHQGGYKTTPNNIKTLNKNISKAPENKTDIFHKGKAAERRQGQYSYAKISKNKKKFEISKKYKNFNLVYRIS